MSVAAAAGEIVVERCVAWSDVSFPWPLLLYRCLSTTTYQA